MRYVFMLTAMVFAFKLNAQTQQRINALHGSWRLISASGDVSGQIPGNQAAELHFQAPGNIVTGFTGCNRLTGEYKSTLDELTLGPLVITKKSCENMEVEILVQRFLPHVGYYKVERDKLYLYDRKDRKQYLTFTRIDGTI